MYCYQHNYDVNCYEGNDLNKEPWYYNIELPNALLRPSPKNKKISAEKKIITFSQKKFFFSAFREKELYFIFFKIIFFIFPEMEVSSLKLKKFRKELSKVKK